MSAYNVTLSDGVTVVTVPDGAIFNTYSVPIIGQNATTYGDDVAAAFLRGLENFAAVDAPDVNVNIPGSALLTGQLWYDTGNSVLKVWNGSSWISLLQGGSGLTLQGDIIPSVDSTYNLGSTSYRWANVWADTITSGVSAAFNAATVTTLNSSNSSLGAASGTTLTLTGLMLTAASTTSGAGLRIPHGAAPTTPTNGDVWTTTSGVYVRINGSTEQLQVIGPASGVTSFNSRTGAVVPQVGDYDSYFPRKDGSTSTIASAATWTFSNRPAFNGGTSGSTSPFTVDSTEVVTNLNADLLDGQNGSYYATDALVVHLAGTETISGAKTFSTRTTHESSSADSVRLVGTSTAAATNQAYTSFYYSNNTTEHGRVGTVSGDSAIELRGIAGALKLYASNYLKMYLTSTNTTIYSDNGSTAAMTFHAASGSGVTSSAYVYDTGGAARNIGFNETPTVAVSGTYAITAAVAGKFLTRTATTTTAVRLDSVADLPVGASFIVHNDNASGTMTITENSTTLQWVDGSGSAPSTGTRTLTYNGVATIRKKSSTVYQIWGNGLS